MTPMPWSGKEATQRYRLERWLGASRRVAQERAERARDGSRFDLELAVVTVAPKVSAPIRIGIADSDGDTIAYTLPDGRIVDLTMAVRDTA